MTAVIETKSLSKWYGNVLGLSDVSLEIESGITGLLGPNGAGKSTFMKLVTGQMKPNWPATARRSRLRETESRKASMTMRTRIAVSIMPWWTASEKRLA